MTFGLSTKSLVLFDLIAKSHVLFASKPGRPSKADCTPRIIDDPLHPVAYINTMFAGLLVLLFLGFILIFICWLRWFVPCCVLCGLRLVLFARGLN